MYIRCTQCKQIKIHTSFPGTDNSYSSSKMSSNRDKHPRLSPWCIYCLSNVYCSQNYKVKTHPVITKMITSTFGHILPQDKFGCPTSTRPQKSTSVKGNQLLDYNPPSLKFMLEIMDDQPELNKYLWEEHH